MIIVKVWGGIGNQLFQYVFGQYLKYRYNQIVKYDDGSYITTDTLRKRELDVLSAEVDYDNSCTFSRYRGIKNRLMLALFRLNPKNHFIKDWTNLPTSFKEGHLYFFQGYWQEVKYYKWLCENVPEFTLKSKALPKELSEYAELINKVSNSVSLHVRRGDFFTPQNVKTYGVCTEQYFNNALKRIEKEVPNGKLFVFSDDLDWVKKNVDLPDDAVLINNYPVSQFAFIELMSLCKHHIISNSSFSWWGAVLTNDASSIVVSPNKWWLTSERTPALNEWIKI